MCWLARSWRGHAASLQLTALTSCVVYAPLTLPPVQELRVVGNQLRILPPEIGQLTSLRVLAADFNQLTILPGAPCGWWDGAVLGQSGSVRGWRRPLYDRHACCLVLQQLLSLRVHVSTGLPSVSFTVLVPAGELRRCEQLEELTLQHNRLTSVLLSFASLRHLR